MTQCQLGWLLPTVVRVGGGICCKLTRVLDRTQFLAIGGLRSRSPWLLALHLKTNTHVLVPHEPQISQVLPPCQISLPLVHHALLLRDPGITLDLLPP